MSFSWTPKLSPPVLNWKVLASNSISSGFSLTSIIIGLDSSMSSAAVGDSDIFISSFFIIDSVAPLTLSLCSPCPAVFFFSGLSISSKILFSKSCAAFLYGGCSLIASGKELNSTIISVGGNALIRSLIYSKRSSGSGFFFVSLSNSLPIILLRISGFVLANANSVDLTRAAVLFTPAVNPPANMPLANDTVPIILAASPQV